LKTPLATANRFLEILHKYKSSGLEPEQRHLVQQAFEAMANTGEVVDALLLLSTVSQQSVELDPLDMAEVVPNVERQLADLRARTQATIELPQAWPRALGYAPWVAEVWLNLLSNALKYGGSPPQVQLGGTAEGAHVRFWVRDNGEPLSDDERARVFTPFTRLHRERASGHGLGLATVQRIVVKLGGTVGARLAPDGGNEFSFSLPAVPRGDRPAPARASATSSTRLA
jgi:signal transduction histidine kinase